MTTQPQPAPIDIEELERQLIAPTDHSQEFRCMRCREEYSLTNDNAEPSRFCDRCAHEVAEDVAPLLLAELRAQAGKWKPFFFDNDSTPIREGQGYLFAAGSAASGWSYFHDALVWDAETYAQWREGDHGFATEDVKFYWELPAPPESSNG